MTRDVICIDADDWLSEAKALFEKHKFHHLMVTNNGELVAVLSARDLFKAISPGIEERTSLGKEVGMMNRHVISIASQPVVSVTEDDNLKTAVTLFEENRISCLPVIDASLRPVGVITLRDVVHLLYRRILRARQATKKKRSS